MRDPGLDARAVAVAQERLAGQQLAEEHAELVDVDPPRIDGQARFRKIAVAASISAGNSTAVP